MLQIVAQLSDSSKSKISKYEDAELDEEPREDVGNTKVNSIKYLHRDKTWTQTFCTYNPPPIEFLGWRGSALFLNPSPQFLTLWKLFWLHTILQQIVT